MKMTIAQIETLQNMVAAGLEATNTSIHPFSGALTITNGRDSAAIINDAGQCTYWSAGNAAMVARILGWAA